MKPPASLPIERLPPWVLGTPLEQSAAIRVVESHPRWTPLVRAAVVDLFPPLSADSKSRLVRQVPSLAALDAQRGLGPPGLAALAVDLENLPEVLLWLARRHNAPAADRMISLGPAAAAPAAPLLREAGALACGFGILAVDAVLPVVRRFLQMAALPSSTPSAVLPWPDCPGPDGPPNAVLINGQQDVAGPGNCQQRSPSVGQSRRVP